MKVTLWTSLVLALVLHVTILATAIKPQQDQSRELHVEEADHSINDETQPKSEFCPNALMIFPCICTTDESNNVYMDCSSVTEKKDLMKIFKNKFPVSDMHRFYMNHGANTDSKILKLSGNIFNKKSFKYIYLDGIDFQFFNVFGHMYDTVLRFDFLNTPVSDFRYDLSHYTQVDTIVFENSKLAKFNITSPTMRKIRIDSSSMAETVEGENLNLGKMDGLLRLYIVTSNLKLMPDTSGYPNLIKLMLQVNQLSTIGNTLMTTNALETFSATGNVVQDIMVGSMNFAIGANVYLYGNQIEYLDEEGWRPLFNNVGFVELDGNPLACGCEMAWMFQNDTQGTPMIQKVSSITACADNTLFSALDPANYLPNSCPGLI